MKDQLGGRIMTKFVGLRAKYYSYLIDSEASSEDVRIKQQKAQLKFDNYKNC